MLARRGKHAEAERLAREAVENGEGTDSFIGQGDANADLAEVLFLARKLDEATEERKGHVVLAQRMRERLAAFPGA